VAAADPYDAYDDDPRPVTARESAAVLMEVYYRIRSSQTALIAAGLQKRIAPAAAREMKVLYHTARHMMQLAESADYQRKIKEKLSVVAPSGPVDPDPRPRGNDGGDDLGPDPEAPDRDD
jgi:hypothetical protein